MRPDNRSSFRKSTSLCITSASSHGKLISIDLYGFVHFGENSLPRGHVTGSKIVCA